MMFASGLTASFLVAGLSAWRLLHAPYDKSADKTLRTAILLAAALAPLQIYAGDLHGLNTLEHQPAKIAAIEALWHTEAGAPLVLFGVPNEKTKRNDYALEIPHAASLILKHDRNAELTGLDAFTSDHPPVVPVFIAFRVMVGMGMLMLLLSWIGAWRLRKAALPQRWLLWTLASSTFAGWIAVLAGWVVTENGRQPWLVTGVLRTKDAVGDISGAALGASLTGYIITYSIMLVAYVVVLTHLAGAGAKSKEAEMTPGSVK
jgi:cytochrome d ubiquinol oxidase subunit I